MRAFILGLCGCCVSGAVRRSDSGSQVFRSEPCTEEPQWGPPYAGRVDLTRWSWTSRKPSQGEASGGWNGVQCLVGVPSEVGCVLYVKECVHFAPAGQAGGHGRQSWAPPPITSWGLAHPSLGSALACSPWPDSRRHDELGPGDRVTCALTAPPCSEEHSLWGNWPPCRASCCPEMNQLKETKLLGRTWRTRLHVESGGVLRPLVWMWSLRPQSPQLTPAE